MALFTTTAENARLTQAVRRADISSREKVLERLFAWAFRGLVYPQIWEDPEIDMEALAITPDCHVVAIASGGCNVVSYLTANPAKITALDLNRAHVALTRLKLSALRHLPSWNEFYRFFGRADDAANVRLYRRHLAPHLDVESRAYWEARSALRFGRRRISMFSRNVYRYGLLGNFIGMGHVVARAYGINLREVLQMRTLQEQRRYFETEIAPLFDKRLVRWITSSRLSLYGLGIPPAQYKLLASAGTGGMATVLRERLERLTCEFSFQDNYFAWQAFGRAYDARALGPLPPYLKRENFDTVRAGAGKVEVLRRSFTEYLESRPDGSVDRYVLLDAQDWMSDDKLNALWREITRTARPGARVVFRTSASPSILDGRVDPAILAQWRYERGTSLDLSARDRSAIYGGFHLYVLAP